MRHGGSAMERLLATVAASMLACVVMMSLDMKFNKSWMAYGVGLTASTSLVTAISFIALLIV